MKIHREDVLNERLSKYFSEVIKELLAQMYDLEVVFLLIKEIEDHKGVLIITTHKTSVLPQNVAHIFDKNWKVYEDNVTFQNAIISNIYYDFENVLPF